MHNWCQSEQTDDLRSDQHENRDMQEAVVFVGAEVRP